MFTDIRKQKQPSVLRDKKQHATIPVLFNLAGWSAVDSLGFSVGELWQLNAALEPLADQLKPIFSFLQPDPYDADATRFRAFATGVLQEVGDDLVIGLSESMIHSQRENTEFPGKARRLPALANPDQDNKVLLDYVAAVYMSAKPHNLNANYGIAWKAHLIRLKPRAEYHAKATPPIPHKDDACWVHVAVLDLENIKGGENSIYNNSKSHLVSFTLAPMQFFLVNDRAVFHHVDTVMLDNPTLPGYRDVVIIEFSILVSATQ
ncbi:hypothetical protein MAH1_21150 [Sessilibacter sp. MAH1]